MQIKEVCQQMSNELTKTLCDCTCHEDEDTCDQCCSWSVKEVEQAFTQKLDAAERVCESVEALLEEAKRGYLDWRLLEIQLSDWRKLSPKRQ
jgi:hypothetical protein